MGAALLVCAGCQRTHCDDGAAPTSTTVPFPASAESAPDRCNPFMRGGLWSSFARSISSQIIRTV